MSPGSTTLAPVSESPGSRLATLPAWPWDPCDDSTAPLTLGYEAARWAETHLIQPNGPRAGLRFRLTHDQFVFLLWWYAFDVDGQWLFQHGVRRLAKGSGKSPFAAVLSLIEFCAPVRLARKDHRLPGGCAGKPVDMPLVQIAATAASQTANTMRMVRAFAPKGSEVVKAHGLDPGKTRYYKLPEGTLEIITSSVTAAEGAETSFNVADETELWKPSNGGPDLFSTLQDNLAKSGSRLLETSNAWVPGIESVAEATWDAWVLQEEGLLLDGGERLELKDEAGRILYDARMAPPDTNLTNYESLTASLQFVNADCEWKFGLDGKPDVRVLIKRIWSNPNQQESKRKHLNWPSVHEDAWCDPADWAKLRGAERVVSQTEDVVLFFDGSKSRDATAVVGCCVSDGHVFVPRTGDGRSTIWEPDPAHDTVDVVPVDRVDAALDHVFDTYNVVGFFGDVKEWESFVKIEWPKRFGDRLQIMAIPAGKDPQQIAWDMRSNVLEFTRAAELCQAEILAGGFTHDGNPILARHVANMRGAVNHWGTSVGKESPSSRLKIDAGVCLIGARMVRRRYLAAAPKKPRSGLVRGIR